jgi:multidrug resistance protein, MATE family
MFKEKFWLEIKKTSKLAWPIIIGQLGVILMGVSDVIMVGRILGKTALAAAGLGNSVSFLIASLVIGGMSVLGPMISKSLSEKNEAGLQKLVLAGIWVAIIYAIVLTALGIASYRYWHLLNQPKEVSDIAAQFFIIIIYSHIPLFIYLALKQVADGHSLPKIPMYLTFFGLIVNIISNYIFMVGWGPIVAYDTIGAALGTLLTRTFMMLILLAYMIYQEPFRSIFKNLKFSFPKVEISELLKRSIPGGFQFFFEIAAFSLAVVMMGWLGETALAAHQVAINVASTTYMMATGISLAGGIRVGDEWGKRSLAGIKRAGFAAYFLVFAFMSSTMILILLFDTFILKAYIRDTEVITAAVVLLKIAALFQLSDGIQVVGLGVLRGLADIKIPTWVTFVAYWVFALPIGYFLGFKTKLGAQGIWLGLLIGLSISAIFLYWRYKNITRPEKLRKLI